MSLMVFGFASLSGCGYRFAGRVVAEQPLAVTVRSAALEPGLALGARRGLESAASLRGLDVRGDAVEAAWSLEVVVRSAVARPAGVVHLGGGTGTLAATSYEVRAVLEAQLVGPQGERHARIVSATSLFDDALLPLWTDDARQRATEQALGLACEELADWLALALSGQLPVLSPDQ